MRAQQDTPRPSKEYTQPGSISTQKASHRHTKTPISSWRIPWDRKKQVRYNIKRVPRRDTEKTPIKKIK